MNNEEGKYKRGKIRGSRKWQVDRGEEEEEGSKKGKLVHAMIMVVNHKSHNMLQRKCQNSQTELTKIDK